MDDYTFGDSEAAKTLSKLVDKGEGNWTSSVKRRLDKFREILSELDKLENSDYKIYLADLLFKDFKEKTHQNEWPEDVKTYTINVATADYRDFLDEVK